eukprot:3903118-Rhodomonas_salina.1
MHFRTSFQAIEKTLSDARLWRIPQRHGLVASFRAIESHAEVLHVCAQVLAPQPPSVRLVWSVDDQVHHLQPVRHRFGQTLCPYFALLQRVQDRTRHVRPTVIPRQD